MYQPDLCTHLTSDSTRRRHLNDPNVFLALSAIFYDMIEDERLAKTYIVVDALDQCRPGVNDFLALITKSLKLPNKIKWLISSHESERFKLTFMNIGCRHVDLSQGLLGMYVAMHGHIAAKVRHLVRTNKYDEELEEEMVRDLHSVSQGNYL